VQQLVKPRLQVDHLHESFGYPMMISWIRFSFHSRYPEWRHK